MHTKLIALGVIALLAATYMVHQSNFKRQRPDHVDPVFPDPVFPDHTDPVFPDPVFPDHVDPVFPDGPSDQIPSFVFDAFTHFQQKFGKKYASSDEEYYRLNVYYQNQLLIEASNSNPSNTYTLGETQFMDLTQEEFMSLYLMQDLTSSYQRNLEVHLDETNLLGAVDWRGRAVTQVKNQGGCGSCWAFSTTGALEGYSAIFHGAFQEYAEQQLVDCAGLEGAVCYGCSGGWPNQALGWVRNHGITYEGSYPYRAVDQQCQRRDGEFRINGVVDVPNNDGQIKAAVEGRPVSICIDASNWGLYHGGVFNNCGHNINHAVLIVAYDDNQWVVKNSWGTGWGESGFIRLAPGNTCGLYDFATYPV